MGAEAGTVPELDIVFYCEQCATVFLDGRDADAHSTISGHSMHKLAPING